MASREIHTKGKGICFSIGINSEAVLVIKSTGIEELITLTAKHRQKGMVCVYVCSQKYGKTMKIGSSNKLLADFKLYKEQNNITRDFC